jgi:CRP-like cAMP-binding protein
MSSSNSPDQNQLLSALPTAEFEWVSERLEQVELQLGEILYKPGEQLQHAWFPTTAIVSLHYVTESGTSVQTAGVGNEGMVGISLFMGGDTTSSSAMVQTAGHAYRLKAHLLKQAFDRAGLIQDLLLRYTLRLITQISQTAACRRHSVEQQLCRWLLLNLDQSPSNESIRVQD